jgi:hypothetical protein
MIDSDLLRGLQGLGVPLDLATLEGGQVASRALQLAPASQPPELRTEKSKERSPKLDKPEK